MTSRSDSLQDCGTFRAYPDKFIGNLRHGDILCHSHLLLQDDRYTFLRLPHPSEFQAMVCEKSHGLSQRMALGADAGHLLPVQSS